MNNNYIKVDFDSMYWNIQAHEAKEEKTGKNLIKLEWGWGAGMTEKERKEAEAENVPAGYESVTTTPEMALMLMRQLEHIIKKQLK